MIRDWVQLLPLWLFTVGVLAAAAWWLVGFGRALERDAQAEAAERLLVDIAVAERVAAEQAAAETLRVMPNQPAPGRAS